MDILGIIFKLHEVLNTLLVVYVQMGVFGCIIEDILKTEIRT